VAQGVGREFKHQYLKKKRKRKQILMLWRNVGISCPLCDYLIISFHTLSKRVYTFLNLLIKIDSPTCYTIQSFKNTYSILCARHCPTYQRHSSEQEKKISAIMAA
jgi:hypothetical protein